MIMVVSICALREVAMVPLNAAWHVLGTLSMYEFTSALISGGIVDC